MNKKNQFSFLKLISSSAIVFLLPLNFGNNVMAAPLVNPSNTPLTNDIIAGAKPNIMFLVDDSGSMLYDFLGDEVASELNCKSYNVANSQLNNFSIRCTNKNASTVSAVLDNYTADTPFFAFDFNKLYYNPNITYKPAVNYAGESLGDQSFTNARKYIYISSSGGTDTTRVNLENGSELKEFYYCNKSGASEAELQNKDICRINGIDTPNPFDYYTEAYPNGDFPYRVSGPFIPSYFKTITKEYCDTNLVNCEANQGKYNVPAKVRWCKEQSYAMSEEVVSGTYITSANRNQNICQKTYDKENGYIYPRFGKFERVLLKNEEKTNYANWYTYYRTRINATKTALGLTLKNIDDSKRVGFVTINPMSGNYINNNKFLKVSDFNENHKLDFYNKFYNLHPSGGTYLMEALSRVGRYYAGKNNGINQGMIPTQSDDPMQYSCQQNYTILATDGYWNNSIGRGINNEAITNEDNINEGYSTRSFGSYDGNLEGASGTLADVAMYFYKTDLRPEGSRGALNNDISENNVPITSNSANTKQHMITYGLSLGLNGFMDYTSDYFRGTSADFENIKSGVSGVCSWTNGVCNWPVPVEGKLSTIDDLWHAAVNGRGRYYSTQNPQEVIQGLQDALNNLSSPSGAFNQIATSSPNITQTDNYIYYSTYRSKKWDGDIIAKKIDPNTGVIEKDNTWSAKSKLNEKVSISSDSRTIYYSYSTAESSLDKTRHFIWNNLSTKEQELFSNKCLNLSQCVELSSSQREIVNSGEALVNWLRGQSQYEETNQDNPLFRTRDYVLGDIVNSSPVYVGKPLYDWNDSGYLEYKQLMSDREPVIYVGANDGMIHAFNAETGESKWSLIPKQVMHNLYKLADKNYSSNHHFFVNGQITTMDVKIEEEWKTVMIVAMGRGGKGYIAIDITNPDQPMVLWEMCGSSICSTVDYDIGYTYGNPIITKRSIDGKFVAYLTSGYDNESGKGIIYELEIHSGEILRKFEIGNGNAVNQVGISKINIPYNNFYLDNTADIIYAGDLNGNVWKLDLQGNNQALYLLGSALDREDNAQPITTKIELGKINNNIVLFIATGQYLNENDINNTDIQSVYAIKDPGIVLTDNYYGTFRDNPNLIEQIVTPNEYGVSETSNEVMDWNSNSGWWFDLRSELGERVNIDPILVMGTLNIISNVPANSVCNVGGNAWNYQINYRDGGSVNKNNNRVANKLATGIITGQNVINLEGSGGLNNIVTDASGKIDLLSIITHSSSNRRNVSAWREIIKQK